MVKRKIIVVSLLFFLLSGFGITINSVNAQHSDVFNIDFDKTKKDKQKKKIATGFIDVVESSKYSIILEKDKLDKNDFSVYDLELFDIPEGDASKYQWHQVPVKEEVHFNQTQTREAGDLFCSRARKGNLYWLTDGKKFVDWGAWSFWSCSREATETTEKTEKTGEAKNDKSCGGAKSEPKKEEAVTEPKKW